MNRTRASRPLDMVPVERGPVLRTPTLCLISALWVVLLAPTAEAQSRTLAQCVERVVNAARQQGARPSSAPVVDFMLTGDHRSYENVLPQDGCLGMLAVGHRSVQNIGLAMFAPTG